MHRACMIDEFLVMVIGGVKKTEKEGQITLNQCEIINLAPKAGAGKCFAQETYEITPMKFARQNFGITIMKDKENSERAMSTIKIANSIKSLGKLEEKKSKHDEIIEPWK